MYALPPVRFLRMKRLFQKQKTAPLSIAPEVDSALRDDLLLHVSCHVCETEVAPRIAISQSFMIEAQQMQYRCVQVMHVNLLFDGHVAELVSGPVGESRLHSAAG